MITLTTDFGSSHYVGALRGAILTVHPQARIADITHGVPRHDVRAGAFALLAAAPYFPEGTVHVAVVDPDVGSARRMLLIEAQRGLLVGPDNGLLMPAARKLGLVRTRALTERKLWRDEVSTTFHGRDVFGPVAAHLDKGDAQPADCGPEVRDAQALDFGVGREDDGGLAGEVILVDTFGNCVLNVPAALARRVLKEGAAVRVEWAGGEVAARFVRTYADGQRGEALALVGSAGFLEVAIAQASFAEASGLDVGMQVRVRPA